MIQDTPYIHQRNTSHDIIKLFVKGLPVTSTRESIIQFFSQFGEVKHCKVKKNSKTKKSMGHACITFKEPRVARGLVDVPVNFNGRICECKPFYEMGKLREHLDMEKRLRLVVSSLEQTVTNKDLSEALEPLFSNYSYAYVVREDPECYENKGYGFVWFKNEPDLYSFLERCPTLEIKGKMAQFSREYQKWTLQKQNREENPDLKISSLIPSSKVRDEISERFEEKSKIYRFDNHIERFDNEEKQPHHDISEEMRSGRPFDCSNQYQTFNSNQVSDQVSINKHTPFQFSQNWTPVSSQNLKKSKESTMAQTPAEYNFRQLLGFRLPYQNNGPLRKYTIKSTSNPHINQDNSINSQERDELMKTNRIGSNSNRRNQKCSKRLQSVIRISRQLNDSKQNYKFNMFP